MNIHKELDRIFNTKRFEQGKTSSVKIVQNIMTGDFILKLYWDKLVDAEEYNLLMSVHNSDGTSKLPRATKTKVKNILINKIKPYYIESKIHEDDKVELDLNLPTVDDILGEIRAESQSSKLPIRITGEIHKKNTSLKQIDTKEEQSKIESNTSEIKIEQPENKEHTYNQKSLVTQEQKTLIRQLKNKMFTKDKIEVFPNQLLSSFIESDEDLSKYSVDLVICDKETLDLICVVVILDKIELDFIATLLHKLNIKRLVVKRNNGILNTQDIRALEEEINNRYAPKCPKCGLSMMQKENIKTKHRFYACLDNQKCRFTIDMGD